MTTDALFDTWALWEVAFQTVVGRDLVARYQGKRVHCSAWVLGELYAKVTAVASAEQAAAVVAEVQRSTTVHPVDAALAIEGARLRALLRQRAPRASLGDGVMLATARAHGLRLIAADAAFQGQPDVRAK